MRCHTSDHYLATSVPLGGGSSLLCVPLPTYYCARLWEVALWNQCACTFVLDCEKAYLKCPGNTYMCGSSHDTSFIRFSRFSSFKGSLDSVVSKVHYCLATPHVNCKGTHNGFIEAFHISIHSIIIIAVI